MNAFNAGGGRQGHFFFLNGLRSVDTKSTFKPTFSEISEKKAHIKILGAVIEKFSPDCIFLGSDDDREGEAIAWHICDIFGLSIENTKRIIFHEVTKPALETAIVNPVRINMKLVNAQHARQVLDVIVGYKISPYLWKYIYPCGWLLVQTSRQTEHLVPPPSSSVELCFGGCFSCSIFRNRSPPEQNYIHNWELQFGKCQAYILCITIIN